MTTMTAPTLTQVHVHGTGIVHDEPTQGIARNVSYYRSVEVWKAGASKYRVTIIMGNSHLTYGPQTSAVVEVWCMAQGWREVLTLDKHDELIDALPTPETLYRSWCADPDVKDADDVNGDIVFVSRELARAAYTILN